MLSSALDWMDVASSLCHFVIDADVAQGGSLPPEWAVFENLLCRGLPTVPSLRVEHGLVESTGLLTVNEGGKQGHGAVNALLKNGSSGDGTRELLVRALCVHAADVALQPSAGYFFPEFGSGEDNTEFDSEAERTFWSDPLARLLGPGGVQLALRQRPLDSLVSQDFPGQRVDIAVELPGWSERNLLPRGLVFEVDGPTHKQPANRAGDDRRDEACKKAGWAATYRHRLWQDVPAQQEIDRQHVGVKSLREHPYLDLINRNARESLRTTDEGRRARHLALAPFAVARIQRVLLELVKGGRLKVSAPVWNIVVIDRDDLPGVGQLAVDDLRDWLAHIYALYSPEAALPEMRMVQVADSSPVTGLPTQADVVIDLSVEMRYGVSRQAHSSLDALLRSGCAVVVRSDYYRRVPDHELSFSEPLTLRTAGERLEHALTFFLRSIFRKTAFREKQVEIITRALQGESVIALLPTGAGKSITYQLPTLLQNGMSAVVAPIKSLMKDQDDNLRAAGISCCAFINSMSSSAERRANTALMVRGCLKFAFISPERLIIREFRGALERMREQGRSHFAYVVVDEAHCVSEWGHDFRTSYLRLGTNARKFCATRWPELPLLALTGTASFEVLDDVHRELGFERKGDISVRPEKMERDNLKFNVVMITPTARDAAGTGEKAVSDAVGHAKLDALPAVLKDLTKRSCGREPISFLQTACGSGLVFCPHAGRRGSPHGALATRDALRRAVGDDEATKIDMYYGSAEEEDVKRAEFDPIGVQTDFKADRLRILACTKAFGMGIDKPDIRFTLHLNIPPSLESFYQEAGRAGRDGEDAQCWLLYAGTAVPEYGRSLDLHLNHQFHSNSFPGADLEEAKAIEILDQNRAPSHAAFRDLEVHLEKDTGIEFSVKPWTSPDRTRQHIYINHPDYPASKVYLYVTPNGDLKDGEKDAFRGHDSLCREAKNWLLANRPDGVAWQDWLFRDAPNAVNPGIEDVLSQTGPDETPRICLSFENGYIEDIADRLRASPADVRKATGFARGVDDFLARLNVRRLPDAEEWVRSVFPRLRLREHTFRALYRLSILGVVTDFEADYKNRTLTADLAHLQAGACRDNLRRYLRKHAPMEADNYLQLADESPNATELRRCLHALMTFVYERIAKQRIEAMTIMEQTCVRGVEDSEAFREAVTYFFDSLYLPRLRPHLQEYGAELVITTIKDTAGSAAKLNHLLGACNRLLPENPENAAFRALRGYAMALLGYAKRDAVSELKSAADKFSSVLGWTRAERLVFLDRLRLCFMAVPDASTAVIDTVILNEHSGWLEKFNAGNQTPGAGQNNAAGLGFREAIARGEMP